MAAALRARAVRHVDREEIETRERAQRRFVGWDCNACPSCGRPPTFGEHVVRCDNSPSHYTRVSLPVPFREPPRGTKSPLASWITAAG
jgi:hypothetical protein